MSLTSYFSRFLSFSFLFSFCSGFSVLFIDLLVIFHVYLRLFIFLEPEDSFDRTLLYGYELPSSFPSQILFLVFYEWKTMGLMMMILHWIGSACSRILLNEPKT